MPQKKSHAGRVMRMKYAREGRLRKTLKTYDGFSVGQSMEEMESGKEENKGNMDGLQEFEAQTVCAIFNEMTTIPEIFQQSGQFCANNILKLTPSIRQVDDNLEIGLLFDSNVLNQTKWIVQCMGKLSIQNPSNYTDITIATIHPAKVTCSFNIHKIYMNR